MLTKETIIGANKGSVSELAMHNAMCISHLVPGLWYVGKTTGDVVINQFHFAKDIEELYIGCLESGEIEYGLIDYDDDEWSETMTFDSLFDFVSSMDFELVHLIGDKYHGE